MVDLDRLKSTLLTSGLQKKDNNLYQVINQLIEAVRTFQLTVIGSSGGGGGIVGTGPFLTWDNGLASLPNSRQLLAGSRISFDDSVFGFRTISADADQDYVVMSDGVTPVPSPVDDGFGNFIYIPYTP
jgi:hypothetical protein